MNIIRGLKAIVRMSHGVMEGLGSCSLLFAFVTGGCATKSEVPIGGDPVLVLEVGRRDLGWVIINQPVISEFNIRNTGARELLIHAVSTSCGCLEARVPTMWVVEDVVSVQPRLIFLSTGATGATIAKNIVIASTEAELLVSEIAYSGPGHMCTNRIGDLGSRQVYNMSWKLSGISGIHQSRLSIKICRPVQRELIVPITICVND